MGCQEGSVVTALADLVDDWSLTPSAPTERLTVATLAAGAQSHLLASAGTCTHTDTQACMYKVNNDLAIFKSR